MMEFLEKVTSKKSLYSVLSSWSFYRKEPGEKHAQSTIMMKLLEEKSVEKAHSAGMMEQLEEETRGKSKYIMLP